VSVKTGGFTFADFAQLAAILWIYPVGVLFVTFASGSRQASGLLGNAIGLGVAFLVFIFLVEEITSVRRIELKPSGVVFRYLFHSEERMWTDLEPGPPALWHGIWYLVSRQRNGQSARQRSFRLTAKQARAVVAYPACPKWNLPAAVASSLGVPGDLRSTS
jgi:hypothetical protein